MDKGQKYSRPTSKFSRVFGKFEVPSAMVDNHLKFMMRKPIIAHLVSVEKNIDLFPIVGWIHTLTGMVVWNKNSWPDLNCAPAIKEAIREYQDLHMYPSVRKREAVRMLAELALWHDTIRFNVIMPATRTIVRCYAQKCIIRRYNCIMVGIEGTDMFSSSMVDFEPLRRCIRWLLKTHIYPMTGHEIYIEAIPDGDPIEDVKIMEEITYFDKSRDRVTRPTKAVARLIKKGII